VGFPVGQDGSSRDMDCIVSSHDLATINPDGRNYLKSTRKPFLSSSHALLVFLVCFKLLVFIIIPQNISDHIWRPKAF